MISWIDVKGLNNQFDYNLDFNSSVNILTSESGVGKTTLLKLIWYLTSGNIHRVIREIPLMSVRIGTTQFDLFMEPVNDEVRLEWQFDNEEQKSEETVSLNQEDSLLYKLNEEIAKAMPNSLFFPTFRRIEGGFTAEPTTKILQQALAQFSEALSSDRHKFISALSTHDIVELLTEKHTLLYKIPDNQIDNQDKLNDLRQRWSALNKEVRDYYWQKYPGGIHISEKIILGAADQEQEAMPSTKLSSGEKQYLGFLCLTTFSESETFFIDEPELSLHVDSQRILTENLKKLSKGKQFFIATHTPFIFARYPESEISLDKLKR